MLVRQSADNMILLANTTFLHKISHSSQTLSMTNIRGSFNGSDIMRSYDDLENAPINFDYLFAIHQGLDWNDNLERLVDASSAIKPKNQKYVPTSLQKTNIYNSVSLATKFIASDNFSILESDLQERCDKCRNEILIASHIENVNIRGRLIESLITSDDLTRQSLVNNLHSLESALPVYDTKNGLGDYYRSFDNGDTYTDIKTKVVYLNSNPKAYNIDKLLSQLADGKSIFFLFFIGIDDKSNLKTLLCSVYHHKLIDNTIFQFHWAGRSSRGVAQLKGSAIDEMLSEYNFHNDIRPNEAKEFLKMLLER